jgi:hypothetical protein
MDSLFMQESREMVQLLAILVKRGAVQSTVIQEMSSVGMPPKRIAELIGTSQNTVNVALHHARKDSNKKNKHLKKK